MNYDTLLSGERCGCRSQALPCVGKRANRLCGGCFARSIRTPAATPLGSAKSMMRLSKCCDPFGVESPAPTVIHDPEGVAAFRKEQPQIVRPRRGRSRCW